MRVDIPVGLQLLFGTSLLCLVIEVFDDLDKVGADVVLPHGCPQSYMPNPVKGLLEVYEDMVEFLLVLEIFLTEDSQVENLLCGAPSCSEACLFFSDNLLHLRFQSVQYDLLHDPSKSHVEDHNYSVQENLKVKVLATYGQLAGQPNTDH